jgi:hypothetical protein
MSAYDMTFSDAIYGASRRYVSRERLETMLEHEEELLIERLGATAGDNRRFFVFADTVAARSFRRHDESHGWMGLRFQHAPRAKFSNIILHVRMLDTENLLQQEALGIAGVNLIYGAAFNHQNPRTLIGSLLDDLKPGRIEVDMIRFSGPAFAGVDNRIMSLELVVQKLTRATLFRPDGEVVQASDAFYKKPILVERGSFRPVTYVTNDMLDGAKRLFEQEDGVAGAEPAILMEITMKNLLSHGPLDLHLDRLPRPVTPNVLRQALEVLDRHTIHRKDDITDLQAGTVGRGAGDHLRDLTGADDPLAANPELSPLADVDLRVGEAGSQGRDGFVAHAGPVELDVLEAPQATEQREGRGIDLQAVDPDMTEIAEPWEKPEILRAPLPAGVDDGLQATFAAGHREIVVVDLRPEGLESLLGRLVHPELVIFQRRSGDLGHRTGWPLRECLEEPLRFERQSHGPGRGLQGWFHRGVRRRLFPGRLPFPFPFPFLGRGGRVEVAANDVDGTAGDLEIPSTGRLGEGP